MKKSIITIAVLAAISSLTMSGFVAADHMSPMGEDWVDMPTTNHDDRMVLFEETDTFVGEVASEMDADPAMLAGAASDAGSEIDGTANQTTTAGEMPNLVGGQDMQNLGRTTSAGRGGQ